jgi:glycosyltransferase involved in cell wall biosynthesis
VKVLLVHNRYRITGGEEEVYAREKELLVGNGHDVIEYIRDNAKIDEAKTGKIRTAVGTLWAADTYQALRSLLSQHHADIAHFHNTFPLISPAAYYACKAKGIPVIQTLHNYRLLCPAGTFLREGRPCEDCLHKSALPSVVHGCYRDSRVTTAAVAGMLTVHGVFGTYARVVDRYVAPSEFTRLKFVEAGFSAERVRVKPHFINRDPGCGSHEGGYALFVGRLSPEKGLRTMLKAWGTHKSRELRVVGDGPMMAELQAMVARDGLSEVSFLGRLHQQDIYEQMRHATFLVYPSECYETFGMAIAEAYACGLPVVASRLGAMREIVKEGETGLEFTAGDPEDLAHKIGWALAHSEEMRRMGRNARAEYEAKYTAARNYELLSTIYDEVLDASMRTDRPVAPSLARAG